MNEKRKIMIYVVADEPSIDNEINAFNAKEKKKQLIFKFFCFFSSEFVYRHDALVVNCHNENKSINVDDW